VDVQHLGERAGRDAGNRPTMRTTSRCGPVMPKRASIRLERTAAVVQRPQLLHELQDGSELIRPSGLETSSMAGERRAKCLR